MYMPQFIHSTVDEHGGFQFDAFAGNAAMNFLAHVRSYSGTSESQS